MRLTQEEIVAFERSLERINELMEKLQHGLPANDQLNYFGFIDKTKETLRELEKAEKSAGDYPKQIEELRSDLVETRRARDQFKTLVEDQKKAYSELALNIANTNELKTKLEEPEKEKDRTETVLLKSKDKTSAELPQDKTQKKATPKKRVKK